jgi:hypothetical protein
MRKIIILGIFTSLLLNCKSSKYANNFKREKKQIENLVFLTPQVKVSAKTININRVDTLLSSKNKELIKETTLKLLRKKYNIESKKYNNSNFELINLKLEQIENQKEENLEISAEFLTKYSEFNVNEKHALMLIYQATYNPKFEPHYKLYNTLSGTILISPNEKIESESDLRVLIINTTTNKIVFYDRMNSSKFDPREPVEIEQMTKSILRKVYYK